MNEFTSRRQKAVSDGAMSYGHADWAVAAVCETWLNEVLMGDSTDDYVSVLSIVADMESR